MDGLTEHQSLYLPPPEREAPPTHRTRQAARSLPWLLPESCPQCLPMASQSFLREEQGPEEIGEGCLRVLVVGFIYEAEVRTQTGL